MTRNTYELFENYMLSCMKDSAHDKEHIYRVLYLALEIAQTEPDADMDVLICACLLHDIGRQAQFADPKINHAQAGAGMAYRFLLEHQFPDAYAQQVHDCILSHRFRKSAPPESIEAKILFDADKIDVCGAAGIARTLLYQGHTKEPLYSLLPDGTVSDGTYDTAPSFFREYKYKLEHIYDHFYTAKGAALAKQRQQAAADFYQSLYSEISADYKDGKERLSACIDENGRAFPDVP